MALASPWACACLAQAQPAAAPRPSETTVHWEAGVEDLQLPDRERMGLASGSILFDVGHGWAFGPAVYGAVTGRRGGLLVGGVTAQKRWSLPGRWTGAMALFAGGGGGASAPVGGGLMLRPAIQLLHPVGSHLQAGLSLSQVRFPSGDIRSTQFGLLLGFDSAFRSVDAPDVPEASRSFGPSGLGVTRMAITATSLSPRDGSGRTIGLVGARSEWLSAAGDWVWGIETAGAASGGAAGYMELLGVTAWRVPLWPELVPGLRVGLRASMGAAGGGAVPTGGGLIGRATALAEWQFGPVTVGLESGLQAGRAGAARGRQTQAWAALDLDRPADQPARLLRTEWSLAYQHLSKIDRTDGTTRPLSTIGLKLGRQLTEHVYATGQAHTAVAGGAGAYALGLLGLGLVQPLSGPWRLGGEVLAGAAGGGGVQTGSGALYQAQVWAGWRPRAGSGEWRVGLGRFRPAQGGGGSPLMELSWTWAQGQTGL